MRRVAWVLVAYAAVSWAVLRGAGWLGGVLALPPLFRTLTVGALLVGVPVAVLLAWRYPDLGQGTRGSAPPASSARGSAAEEPGSAGPGGSARRRGSEGGGGPEGPHGSAGSGDATR